MHRLFTGFSPSLQRTRPPSRLALPCLWYLLGCAALFGVLVGAPLTAANFGGTWEDPDPDATARAVQVQLIRLASTDPKQVEQAELGLESLGLNALPLLQAALAAPDCAPALQPHLQALVDRLLHSAVITVKDQFGHPVADTSFVVVVYWEREVMAELPTGPPQIYTNREKLREIVVTTSSTGRLVVSGIRAPHEPLPGGELPPAHSADTGAVAVLIRKDVNPVDGIASQAEVRLTAKQTGMVLAVDAAVVTGVVPPLVIRDQHNRPVTGAAVIFFPAEAGVWSHSRLADRPFAFDPASHLSAAGQQILFTQSLLWNPASALNYQTGCCSPLTDSDGELQVGRLAPGQYALQVVAPGFARLTVPEFVVPETIAEDAEPTVLKLTPTERSFCAGSLKTTEGAPLKNALAYLLPADQIYDATHIVELADFERRQRQMRRVDAIKAHRDPTAVDALPMPSGFTAANVPLAYLGELTGYPQIRRARSADSGRIEFPNLAEGKYVLRVFVGTADAMEPADLKEFLPAAGTPPPTLTAKAGGPIDLATLQYKPAPAAVVPPAPPAPDLKEGGTP